MNKRAQTSLLRMAMNRGLWLGVPASAGQAFDESDLAELPVPCRLKARLQTTGLRQSLLSLLRIALLSFLSSVTVCSAESANPNSGTTAESKPPVMDARSRREAETKDAVVFQNGDVLYGTLQMIEADGSIRWRHPDALEPIDFFPGTVTEVQLGSRPWPPFSATNGCQVRLTNQDELEGNLVLCDAEKLVLETWYAGRVEIPRPRVQWLAPASPDRKPIFEGPSGLEGWTHGKVASAVPNAGEWKYKNGAFYASRSASIARDLKLPDVASIQFDLTWKGLLYIAIALYADYLQPINLTSRESEPDFGGFYSLQLYNYAADLKPVTKKDALRSLGQTPVPVMIQKNKIHLEIRVHKAKHSIALLADGALIKQWTDPEGFIGSGTSMRFVHQGQGSVKLNNLRISEWDGQFDEKPAVSPESTQDLAKLLNGDKVAGSVQTIQDGKMSLALADGKALEIPMNRVRLVELAGQKSIRAKADPAEIQAVFRRGGSITLRLEKWTEQEVEGVSPNFGRMSFRPEAFERVHFGAGRAPKSSADASNPSIGTGRAVVRAVRGSADYQQSASDWQKLSVGKVLWPGTVIRTASDSQVDLFFGDAMIRLRPETILGLAKMEQRHDGPELVVETLLKLEKGCILGNVRNLAAGSKWEVHTPHRTIAMTDGGFEAQADEAKPRE